MTIAPPDPQAGPLIIENAQLIGGEWVRAAERRDHRRASTRRPARSSARVPRGGAADVDAAVRAAEAAFPAWRDTSATDRAARSSPAGPS